MSQETVAAKRYARALFEVAAQQQKGLEVEQELRVVVSAIEGDADIQKFISTPNIPRSVKMNALNKALAGKISKPVLNTIELLLEKGRTDLFAELLNSYVKIQGASLGMADAAVYSTYPLSDQEKEQVAAEFGQMAQQKIRVTNVVDESLLGGLKVVIGDKLYDGSLSGKLERLEKSFNRQA
ncbi:F-type H+-transporting ATPase subunit delta [Paenibacillus uliginis N3/975]|uniref:ATP synthase subunit delta n=1 Tax=Paenibacillus uliginis N3/975 TaxID=1313296 RepID=A0A1X7GBT7_9BACL|nr:MULTISPECIES: F0F1 ATP synthase subunit delta [Paenibacillus]UNK18106.1 F0F1 ATP synthase subunit delta [Paenibacillus sp. N3/727]SMF66917.1 F-type H+-transporting ATPase subunit delta [Paenibacillus uliginis N3/975]